MRMKFNAELEEIHAHANIASRATWPARGLSRCALIAIRGGGVGGGGGGGTRKRIHSDPPGGKFIS